MFYGRERELRQLREEINKQGQKSAVLIYGKRRVGKSTLIREAAKSFHGVVINFLCVSSTWEGNLDLLGRSVCQALDLPSIRFETIFDLMSYLGSLDQPILLILDEYSYLKQTRKQNEVDSYLQNVIDHMASNTKLILCGSYITMMKELLEEGNPLFGRFTLIQHLREFDYYDAAAFYPDLSVQDKVAYYAVFGGSPYVLSNLNYQESIEENIKKVLLPETSIIRSHIENIMLKEIQKSFDIRILEVLGNGKKRYSEISAILRNHETGLLEKQLKNLLNMETIQKTEPINRPDDARKRFYEITDNLMRFYFAFMFANSGSIARIGEEQFYFTRIQASLRQFISRRLEGIALQYFRRMSGRAPFDDLIDYGTFWYDDPVHHRNGEFDCVVKKTNGLFDFYECKYYDHPMKITECEEEEAQVQEVMNRYPKMIDRIGFICTGGFEAGMETKYLLIDGNTLYR